MSCRKSWVLWALAILLFISSMECDELYEPVVDPCTQCSCHKVDDTAEVQSLFVLDCSISGFKSLYAEWPIPADLPQESTFMASYSGNVIKSLQQLPATDRRMWFSCRHCALTDIESAAFLDTPNVERLDLSFNDFTGDKLLPDVFRGRFNTSGFDTIRLQRLDLSHNKIDYLQYDLFEHTPNLQHLTISNNPFLIPLNEHTIGALASLPQLTKLDMSSIGMDTLPEQIMQNLKSVTDLNISGNKFITIPACLPLVGPTLQSLSLAHNSIQRLDENSFMGLQKVQNLNMSHLEDLHEIVNGTFQQLPAIAELIVSGGRNLTSLDLSEFLGCQNLKKIDISNSSIHTLEYDISPEYESFLGRIELDVNSNEWHCNCRFFKVMDSLQKMTGAQDFRCVSPYPMSGVLSSSFTQDGVCSIENQVDVKIPRIDKPPFLRPKAILLSILAVCVVIALGLLVGLIIALIQKKLRANSIMSPQPIKYTTIRESVRQ